MLHPWGRCESRPRELPLQHPRGHCASRPRELSCKKQPARLCSRLLNCCTEGVDCAKYASCLMTPSATRGYGLCSSRPPGKREPSHMQAVHAPLLCTLRASLSVCTAWRPCGLEKRANGAGHPSEEAFIIGKAPHCGQQRRSSRNAPTPITTYLLDERLGSPPQAHHHCEKVAQNRKPSQGQGDQAIKPPSKYLPDKPENQH